MTADEEAFLKLGKQRLLDDFQRHLNTTDDHLIITIKSRATGEITDKKQVSIYSIADIEQNFEHAGVVIHSLGIEYEQLPWAIRTKLEQYRKGVFVSVGDVGIPDSGRNTNQKLVFTSNVYLYTDKLLVPESDVIECFRRDGMRLVIRDNPTWEKIWKNRPYDGYLIHDSRDKKAFVSPLYDALEKRLLKIWYDETALEVGDDLAEKIEKGLQTSNYAILVVSDNFLENESWAKKEFEKVKERQLASGKKIILPVWHKIRSRKVVKYSEWLGTKVAASDENVEKVADRLARVLKHHL